MVNNLITTPIADRAWRPDSTAFSPTEVLPEALVLRTSTLAGEIEGDAPSVRVAVIRDAKTAAFTTEGSEISESNPELDEALVYTHKLTRLVSLSNEQARQPGTPQQIAESVARDLVRKADEASFYGSAPMTGLNNIPGFVGAGGVTSNLDNLVEAIAQVEENGGEPSHIVVSPRTWASIVNLKVGSSYNQTLLGAGTVEAPLMLLGLPVLKSRFVPAWTGLVLDSRSIVSASGPVNVAWSDHSLFSRDGVQFRATWRFGFAVTRPEWNLKFDTAQGS